jgi:hypothetical protein
MVKDELGREYKDETHKAIVGVRWFWWKGKPRCKDVTIVGKKAYCQVTPSTTATLDAKALFKTRGRVLATEHKMIRRFAVSPYGELVEVYVKYDQRRGVVKMVTENGLTPYWMRYKGAHTFKSKSAALRRVASHKTERAKKALKQYRQAHKAADRAHQIADAAG